MPNFPGKPLHIGKRQLPFLGPLERRYRLGPKVKKTSLKYFQPSSVSQELQFLETKRNYYVTTLVLKSRKKTIKKTIKRNLTVMDKKKHQQQPELRFFKRKK